MSESDIEPRNAPFWQDNTDGGGVYDVRFGNNIEVDMTIHNPPFKELQENNPNLNKYRLSVAFDEDTWNIEEVNLDFNHEDWGYYAEKGLTNYSITLDIDETGDFPSEFYIMTDFELN